MQCHSLQTMADHNPNPARKEPEAVICTDFRFQPQLRQLAEMVPIIHGKVSIKCLNNL